MTKYLGYMLASLVPALVLLTILYITQYSNENFMIKAALLAGVLLVFFVVMTRLDKGHLSYPLILMSFLNISIKQYYTTSTNVFIVIALFVIYMRHCIERDYGSIYARVVNSGCSFPFLTVLCSYTVSFAFAGKDRLEHLMSYQSIVCASLLALIVVGTVTEKRYLNGVNLVLLIALLMNLAFSATCIVYPGIDAYRAEIFSLEVHTDEAAFRLQGLSFRGEAYGEYLMICALWLFTMLVRSQFTRGRLFLWLVLSATVTALIMNMSRGANAVFAVGAVLVLLSSKSVPASKKAASLVGVALLFVLTVVALKASSAQQTLLDRFSEFSDTSSNVGYIPATRYYTWMPNLQMAKKNYYLGLGPSYKPYIDSGADWNDIVNDDLGGNVVTWPHNITILVLCTVGVYGLLSYIFLLYRTVRLRHTFEKLDPFLRTCYSGYMVGLVAFLVEGQKFDGVLRDPTTCLYFLFTMIGMIFTSENIVNTNDEQELGVEGAH